MFSYKVKWCWLAHYSFHYKFACNYYFYSFFHQLIDGNSAHNVKISEILNQWCKFENQQTEVTFLCHAHPMVHSDTPEKCVVHNGSLMKEVYFGIQVSFIDLQSLINIIRT